MCIATVYNVQIQILVQIEIRHRMCSCPYYWEGGRGVLLQLISDLLLKQRGESTF